MTELNDRIDQLKMEIKAMQTDSLLRDETYGEKVKELMKLRRQQVQKGKKPRG